MRFTNDPSPKRVSSNPWPLSRCKALRIVTRLTPNCTARSFSEGILSPGFHTPVRICSFSWSKTCWLTLLRTTFLDRHKPPSLSVCLYDCYTGILAFEGGILQPKFLF